MPPDFSQMPSHSTLPLEGERGGGPGLLNVMKESTKRTIKTVLQFVVTVITALLTTLGAHAANLVQ